MKILIINDYYKFGGAEVQSLREKHILEDAGHDVYLMTFDEKYKRKSTGGFINIPVNYNAIKKVCHSFGIFKINSSLLSIINQEIDNIAPDIIHVNNINKEPFTIYNAIKKYKVVQTLRDYSAVCFKSTCIKNNENICNGYEFNNCKRDCIDNVVKILKYNLWKKVYSLRKETIKYYIAPSQALTNICAEHKYNIRCINNSFDFKYSSSFKKETDFKNKKYLYYGAINKNKGVMELIESFKIFQKDKNVELIIAGKVFPDIKDDFYKAINGCPKIKHLGMLEYTDMLKTLQEVYCVVVPSVWLENYPNTVLESLSLGILVIGSNRGGIPEMLADDRGLLFNVKSKEDIVDKLEKTYNFSEEKYNQIIEKNMNYTKNNNSKEMYYTRLITYFSDIINS